MRPKVFIFTGSYPYSEAAEDTFLDPELHFLKRHFEIHIIPLSCKGDFKQLDQEIIIHEEFGLKKNKLNFLLLMSLLKTLVDKRLYQEIIEKPSIIKNASFMKELLKHLVIANKLEFWLMKHRDLFEDSIAYTYWFDYGTTAVSKMKKKLKGLKVVTRAHGYDLYFERRKGYIPLKAQVLKEVDRVFLVSEHGLNYMKEKFPEFSHKFSLAPLGIFYRNILNKPSQDGKFRIVSCSYIVPVKRVEMIAKTIYELSKLTSKEIEWYHIGSGPLYDQVKKLSEKLLNGRVHFNLMGYVENEKIFEFYRNQPLDLFITLSESEGKPVALMEATSVGLPILAPDVGGIPEIVKNGVNGILVPENCSPKLVAKRIKWLIDNEEELQKMRVESVNIYHNVASAEVNFEKFSKELLTFFEND